MKSEDQSKELSAPSAQQTRSQWAVLLDHDGHYDVFSVRLHNMFTRSSLFTVEVEEAMDADFVWAVFKKKSMKGRQKQGIDARYALREVNVN